jgi:hypothetical protein
VLLQAASDCLHNISLLLIPACCIFSDGFVNQHLHMVIWPTALTYLYHLLCCCCRLRLPASLSWLLLMHASCSLSVGMHPSAPAHDHMDS